MTQIKKTVLVVLGMHRSGTSALTRGLQVLGVSLGENLMPAFEGNNSKGFWEDLEIVAINDAILAALGMDWHSLGSLHRVHDWSELQGSDLARRAEEYLRDQTDRFPLFGIKDPRMARLLPFWREIFHRCEVEPVFVISTRDPVSVADSLARRDGFLPGKSYYLWLEHMLSSVLDTVGAKRCVVGFDYLLDRPAEELARIARVAGLPAPEGASLDDYRQTFLDRDLRHFRHEKGDLEIDPDLATEVSTLFGLLDRLATDEASLEDGSVSDSINALRKRLLDQAPTYRLMSALNKRLSESSLLGKDLEKELENKNLIYIAERERNTELQAELDARFRQMVELQSDIDAIRSSTSWRVTRPLRMLSEKKNLISAGIKKQLLRQSKRFYHALPAGLRNHFLQFGFHFFGFMFRGLGPYENWRLNNSAGLPATSELAHFAFRRSGLDVTGRYGLESGHQQSYCYMPPRHTEVIEHELAGFSKNPLISIITPVYGVEPCYLEALINSVRSQWYSNWELVLVEDAGPNNATRDYLSGLHDKRIKVFLCEKNGGISVASNIAIGMAEGEYLAFLDHDDELTPDALFELVKAINLHDPDFIYSDEDKIDIAGNFSMPFFKPDWSPDALMSIMYTCHFGCVRKSLVDDLGGFRPEFDGAQDYDLVMRLSERTQNIHHIPKILYHWRTLPTSTAAGLDAKPYACDAARRLKEEALSRRNLSGSIEAVQEMPGQFRVNYHPVGAPRISIIIPSRDNAAVLRRCMDSIFRKTGYANYEVVLIDNQSVLEASLEYFEEASQDARVKLLRYPQPFNYSAINNFGARESDGDYLLFLNDDTEVLSVDWLERLLGFAQLSHAGAVGAKLLFPDGGGIQHCGVLNLAAGPGHAFYAASPSAPLYFGRNILEWNWLAVTGACLMVARCKFEEVGGFDEQFPVAYNDIDLCWRLHDQGYRNIVCNAVSLVHYESVSRGHDHEDPVKLERLGRERRNLYRKHPEYFMHDPYFNANLHAGNVNFLVQNY